jgi:alpha-L-rhamnosidase
MHGSIGAWFYKYLAGIQPDPEEPGWARIHVKPYPVGDLSAAKASLETLRGTVAAKWERGDGRFALDVAIPANSRATVSVPLQAAPDATVLEGGVPVWEGGVFRSGVPGVRSATLDEGAGYVRFEVGSGTYLFEAVGAA